LVYFLHSFDDETLAAMYSGPRDARYLSIRRHWERIGFATDIIGSYIDIGALRNVVDYGGDEGP
jgi:hypothetical protein